MDLKTLIGVNGSPELNAALEHLTARSGESRRRPFVSPSDNAEFEVMEWFGDEGFVPYASTYGQRQSALAEALIYASQIERDGFQAQIVEVTRVVVWPNPSF